MNVRFMPLLVIALSVAACNPQPQGHVATPAPADTGAPPLVITGRGNAKELVHFQEQSNGHVVYRLSARSYVSHSAQNAAQAVFSQAQVTFYDKDGTRLQARAPRADVDNRQVILSGGVHATTSTNLALTCDRLVYDQATSLLHGQGHVRITGTQSGAQQELTGSTFTSDVKLTRMTIR
jgi:LPS export ABC transporter protein LptC